MRRPQLRMLSAGLLCSLFIACSDGTAPDRADPSVDPLRIVVEGAVETDDDGPRSGVTVSVQLERSVEGWRYSPVGSAVTGADGSYIIELELDSLPAEGSPELRTEAATEVGTGYEALFERRPVVVTGSDYTLENDLLLRRTSEPAPEPPFASLEATALVTGMYDGETIPPHTLGFQTWLRFRVDSVTDAVHGRWNLSYSATTVGGEGTFSGTVSGDTLHLVLADTANGLPGGNCGGTFELDVVAPSADADTLIAWLSRGTATECHVDAAPFRLGRVPVGPDFD